MLSRRALSAAARAVQPVIQQQSIYRAPFSSTRYVRATGNPEIDDPDMNGGYINPPPIKRQFRDPYGDYTYKQDRRSFGEPVHEDNDILGTFSLEEYTHMTPRRGALMWAGFVSVVLGLSYTVYVTYPDRPSAPKEYPDGLAVELGGPGALRAHKAGDPVP